ncbi:MAG: gliding motility protein GldM [Paludibacteraceae bacterium]|nr:gliding motility protein GldM [Paludibacteraceae bacterium]
MMYLVLTAMLALNVSADILNGFNKLRHSMESSIVQTDARTEDIMNSFMAAYSKDEGSMKAYGDWWKIAQTNKQICDEFYNYIEQFKLDMVNMVEGQSYTEMPKDVKNGSDTNKPHQYALNEMARDENGNKTGRTNAQEFRKRMEEYRAYMVAADSEVLKNKMAHDEKFRHDWELKADMYNSLFSTEDVVDQEGRTIAWERSIFEEMPAGAVFAMLTKYQNDIRIAENDYLGFLFSAAGRSDFVVNSVEALVMPTNGEYIMQGGHYRARIVSAMVDTNQTPKFYINGQEYTDGVYDVVASRVGEQTYTGYMLLPDDTTRYMFKGQYTVGAPSATISNKDMDIIYSGYDNKYDISVPGVPSDRVKVNATGASISKSSEGWIVRPSAGAKTVTLAVTAEMDGRMTQMGSQTFRVKPLPKPSAFFVSNGQMYDGSEAMAKRYLTAGDAHLEASYGPDGVLNLPFTIISFELYAGGRIMKTDGAKFSKEMTNAIGKMKSNEMLNILTIKYKEPGGNIRALPNLGLRIK